MTSHQFQGLAACLLFVVVALLNNDIAMGFSSVSTCQRQPVTALEAQHRHLSSHDDHDQIPANLQTVTTTTSRRQLLSSFVATGAALSFHPTASHATYSAYTRREQDWANRIENGEVQYSSARELRQQLREIVPQNSEKSKLFCPNGPSAAVSPLMENKCGDRLAMPSVYGRSDDIMGNSIPGFSAEWKTGGNNGYGMADTGGFPSYSTTLGKRT